jgi:hypothetical protein
MFGMEMRVIMMGLMMVLLWAVEVAFRISLGLFAKCDWGKGRPSENLPNKDC